MFPRLGGWVGGCSSQNFGETVFCRLREKKERKIEMRRTQGVGGGLESGVGGYRGISDEGMDSTDSR